MVCRFGQYQVLARIATSQTCQTFVALQVGADEFRRIVCLRTLLPDLCQDERAKNAFAHAAKLAAKLSHPTCVGVEAFGQERGIYYFAMEYVAGETWETILTKCSQISQMLRPE